MLIDGYGREVNYLRISVTERCNFRCLYCMPNKPFSWVPRENLLSFEELFKFVKVAIDLGIRKIRITGGEPLVREDLDYFISLIHNYNPNIDLALTTNGYLLSDFAAKLKRAGLKRINISLDSLKPAVAAKIAQKNVLPKILSGIEVSKELGFKIKINMVPLKGINDNEILDILEFGKKRDIEVRFIEYMENIHANKELKGLYGKEILEHIKKRYKIKKIGREGSSPSFKYQIEGSNYTFGLIDPHKHDFCESCNRIRLTAEGYLIPCLYFEDAKSISEAIKSGDTKKAVEILKDVLANKPKENKWSEESVEDSSRAFYETGG
ncbi:MAG: GTP 3',8-cyclase MoaA [Epsilonproteobacteria bacterium]|nr:GTP 3',8-cyclase MoaA [Campylobacterota bacterium]